LILIIEAIYPRLEPFLTSISDPEMQRYGIFVYERLIITRIVFGIIFSVLFLFGLVIYSIFYALYIPAIERSMDIFMEYKNPSYPDSIIANIDLNSPLLEFEDRVNFTL
jgi:hypothetical protein